jgi:hypothetical protein
MNVHWRMLGIRTNSFSKMSQQKASMQTMEGLQ